MKKVLSVLKRYPYIAAGISALLTASIILITFAILQFAPFGDNAIAVGDAPIQYRDFFNFLRRVLLGEDSLLFTFTKCLGGSALALFAYYLSSPLNLLILFFEPGKVDIFINVLFVIKAALAAATFSIFLIWRFRERLQQNSARLVFVILLSLGYSLSQYVIAQSSNIMWLDGVYMLPLMMLGASKLVRENRGAWLGVVTGLTILFNWYAGGMNCLFIILWFLFELANQWQAENLSWAQIWRKGMKFVVVMILAVMVSAVLFLPSVLAVLGSSHGSLAWSSLIKPIFIGSPMSIIDRYTLGVSSEMGNVSLFCGGLALIGVIMLFLSRRVARWQKTICGVFLGLLILTCFFQPLVILFSLLEIVYSYWYRYSYVIIAALLTLSGMYFIVYAQKQDFRRICQVGVIAAVIVLVMNYLSPNLARNNWYYTRAWYTIILLIVIAVLSGLLIRYMVSGEGRRRKRSMIMLLLCGAVIVESALGVGSFVRTFRDSRVSETETYVEETMQLLHAIQAQDDGSYRISQTTTQRMDAENKTANYNESLAYGYKALASYTSIVEDVQIALLDHLGYRADYEIKNIVNTSIIGADSLLGVKYVMSPYPINGLQATNIASETSEKRVYENPYALPMALVYPSNDLGVVYAGNPFTFQNELYSKLLGRKVELYKPLKCTLVQAGNVQQKQTQQYQIEIPKGNYAVYGQIFPTDHNWDMILDVDGKYQTAYARDITPIDGSLSPSVFYIPSNGKAQKSVITLSSNESYYLEVGTEQFYALDLDLLRKIVTELKQKSPEVKLVLNNTEVTTRVEAQEGQALFLSITWDEGWEIWRNDEKITPELVADALYSIPLVEGENQIQLKYHTPGFGSGVIISGLGVLGLIGLGWVEWRQRKTLTKTEE